MALRTRVLTKNTRVRVLAADDLIKAGPPDDLRLVAALNADKSKSVQGRMAYYQKKWVVNARALERAIK